MMRNALPRIGMLHFSCPPIIGGVESVLATHARMVLDAGHSVTAIVGRGGAFDRRLGLRLIPLIDSRFDLLESINGELRQGIVSADFQTLTDRIDLDLTDSLRDIDICIVHNALTLHFNLPLTVALHRIAQRGEVQLIAWCHDLSWTNPLYLPLMHDAEPWTLLKRPAHNTRYVTVSEFRAGELSALFEGKAPVQAIPNGIDAGRFLSLSQATIRLLRELGAWQSFPFLLLPARITRRKNIELAIRIVAELKAAGARPLLLVTGPPGPHNPRSIDYVDELDALAESLAITDNLVLLHRLWRTASRRWSASDTMMRELYRVADALMFPSAQEGFGIPVLEAGLARLPAFCADIQPFRDIAGPNLQYFNLDESPALIAQRILEVLGRNAEAQLHRSVLMDYDWSMIFEHQLLPLVRRSSVDSLPGASEDLLHV
ncbi:MAG: glycosyltransferase [Chloroflexota bacterium]